MKFVTGMVRRLRRVHTTARLLKETGLINTTDLLVATGATVVLAAGVGAAVIGTLDDAKYAKAQPDGQAIATAIAQFYQDTGKWPGQAEHAAATQTAGAVPSTLLVSTTDSTFLPTEVDSSLAVGAAACEANSLHGFTTVDIAAAATFAASTKLNLNDYLLRKPDTGSYPNWQGPYLQAEIKTDPWDRAWVANLQPLYCAEAIADATGSASAVTAGNLGYAWLLSGGSNRTISTDLGATALDASGDDAGVNLGKLVLRSTGGGDAQ